MSQTLDQVAHDLGFEVVTEPGDELRYGLERILGNVSQFHIDWLIEKRSGDVRFVVADVSYRSASGDSQSRLKRETMLYFEQPGLTLPGATIQPRSLTTGLLAVAMNFAGIQQVQFEDDPQFHEACQVMTLQPESTRALLEPALREYLTANPGLTVRTDGPRLVVYRAGQRVDPADLPAFIDETDNVAVSLARRGAQLESLGIDPEAEARAALQRSPALRGRVVPRADLEAFLQQPPPRSIPRTIKRQYLGFAGLFFYVWGGMFLVAGTAVIAGLVAAGEMPPLIALPFSLIPLIGLGAIVVTFLYRRRHKRLLAGGVCRPARVTDVRTTNVTVNNQRRYKVDLQYEFDGRDMTGTINAYDPAVRTAFSLRGTSRETRILVDPLRPDRLLWIDSLPTT